MAQRIFCRNLAAVVYEWKGKWLVACDPRFGDHYGLKEVFVHADYDSFIHASIRGGSISYVNIGANVGAFDIAVASLAPGGSSGLSVELNPKTYARLLFNLSVNNLEGVRAINAAIGRRTGVVGFFPSKISLEDSIFGETTGGTHKVEVRMLTLEDLLNEDGDRSRTFDLLKLDCEGAEYEIIAATSEDVLRRFSAIVMELHDPHDEHSADAVVRKLQTTGFERQSDGRCSGGARLEFWTYCPGRSTRAIRHTARSLTSDL